MSSDSTLYTIGTALNRARDNEIAVEILVEGQWLGGTVVALDGFGVVVESEDHQHAVVRMESIVAVKIGSPAPIRRQRITAAAHPMPAPLQPEDDVPWTTWSERVS